MNATKARQIIRRVKRYKPADAKLSPSIVARKARRYYTHWHKMPSVAQIRRWYQRKPAVKETGATMPVKLPPVPKPKPAPWYRRLRNRIFGAKQ